MPGGATPRGVARGGAIPGGVARGGVARGGVAPGVLQGLRAALTLTLPLGSEQEENRKKTGSPLSRSEHLRRGFNSDS